MDGEQVPQGGINRWGRGRPKDRGTRGGVPLQAVAGLLLPAGASDPGPRGRLGMVIGVEEGVCRQPFVLEAVAGDLQQSEGCWW